MSIFDKISGFFGAKNEGEMPEADGGATSTPDVGAPVETPEAPAEGETPMVTPEQPDAGTEAPVAPEAPAPSSPAPSGGVFGNMFDASSSASEPSSRSSETPSEEGSETPEATKEDDIPEIEPY